MPDFKGAEQILRLAMPAEKAASIAGDLTEASPSGFQLWTSLIRIVFSMLWKDVSASPGRTAYLVAAGAGMQAVFFLPFAAACFPLVMSIGVIAGMLGGFPGWLISYDWWVEAPFAFLVFGASVPAPYLTGRWIGRRAPGHELAPCLALGIAALVLWVCAVAVFGDEVELMDGLAGILPTAACLFVAIASLWMGAIHVRTPPARSSAWYSFEQISFDAKPAWRVTGPAQQRLLDALLLLAPIAIGPAMLLYPPSGTTLTAVLGWMLAAVTLGNAILNRPLQWVMRGRAMEWIGRGLFAMIALGVLAIVLLW